MNEKRRDPSEFIATPDGVEDVTRGWSFKRQSDGQLNGNLPFNGRIELDADFVESLKTAQKVNEDWLRARSGDEPAMDEY